MATLYLSSEDQRFFAAINDVVFANPFAENSSLLVMLANVGLPVPAPYNATLVAKAILEPLAHRLHRLRLDGPVNLRDFGTADQTLLEYALLFQHYNQLRPELDGLIRQQLQMGERPVPVSFAAEFYAHLGRYGFKASQITHYLAFYYQLRRAFYFIEEGLAGASPCINRLRYALWNNVFTRDMRAYHQYLWNRMEDFSTLLLGETGTGKGAVASAIGRSGHIPFDREKGRFSVSFHQIFSAINLSQFPENLIESELFGHRKGAFTGAVDHYVGVFQRCSTYGALLLDEIGEVTAPIQIKLLKVLQERLFSPVGGREEQRFSGRVIAATNRPLQVLRAGGLRQDFFYRLCSDVIVLPTLRQRIAEYPIELQGLVETLLRRIIGSHDARLTARVAKQLLNSLPNDYAWPGNVRELEQALRQILLTGHFQGTETTQAESLAKGIHEGEFSAKELVSRYCVLLYKRLGSYQGVARHTGLDRRTVKRYIDHTF